MPVRSFHGGDKHGVRPALALSQTVTSVFDTLSFSCMAISARKTTDMAHP